MDLKCHVISFRTAYIRYECHPLLRHGTLVFLHLVLELSLGHPTVWPVWLVPHHLRVQALHTQATLHGNCSPLVDWHSHKDRTAGYVIKWFSYTPDLPSCSMCLHIQQPSYLSSLLNNLPGWAVWELLAGVAVSVFLGMLADFPADSEPRIKQIHWELSLVFQPAHSWLLHSSWMLLQSYL